MIDNFKTDLLIRVAQHPRDEILRKMGYRRINRDSQQRIDEVLNSPEFGLEAGRFDFRYDSESFLQALCLAVGMDEILARERIRKIKKGIEEERAAFKPYIWVDTDFERKNQPLFALAATDHWRFLNLPEGCWRDSLVTQLKEASILVRDHYSDRDGFLGPWGPIQRYWFYHQADWALVLNPFGDYIEDRRVPVPQQVGLDDTIRRLTHIHQSSDWEH